MGRVLFTQSAQTDLLEPWLASRACTRHRRALPEAGSKGIVWSEGLKLSIA